MQRQIKYGSTTIKYELFFSNRKTLGITVQPNGKTVVNAPVEATEQQIEAKLQKRASWILKQQRYFKEYGEERPKKRFVSGESHYYLGRQYVLHVSEGEKEKACYKGACFEVVCKNRSRVEALMNALYRERAKIKFAEIAKPILRRFKILGYEPTSLCIQEMNNRWGSCTNNGKIILNRELIKAPAPCIAYVITHELCHLAYRNHTKEFYDMLTCEMPDWKRWKEKLERFMR